MDTLIFWGEILRKARIRRHLTQKEVADILADGKVTMMEFMSFVQKHDVDISLADLPKYMEEAKKLGFIK